jgi:hypothetical protein
MRELIRFGEDFHETCSIRSKLVKTKMISKQLDDLLVTNTNILKHEKQVLGLFAEKRCTLGVQKQSTINLVKKTKSEVF